MLDVIGNVGSSLERISELDDGLGEGFLCISCQIGHHSLNNFESYRKCLCPNIVVNRDIDSKVGVADGVSEKIRSLTLGVVLTEELIVWRSVFFLIIRVEALEVGYPLNLITTQVNYIEDIVMTSKLTLQST